MNFVTKEYVSSAEVCDKLELHIATFSKWINEIDEVRDRFQIVKMGNITFIRKDLPKFRNYRERLEGIKLTDYSDLVPLSYLKSEYNFDEDYLREHPELGEFVTLTFSTKQGKEADTDKTFFKFNSELRNKLRRAVWYTASKREIESDPETFGDIQKIQIAKDKFLTYY